MIMLFLGTKYQVHWSLSVLQIQAVVKKYDILFIADEVCAYLTEP